MSFTVSRFKTKGPFDKFLLINRSCRWSIVTSQLSLISLWSLSYVDGLILLPSKGLSFNSLLYSYKHQRILGKVVFLGSWKKSYITSV